MLAHDPPSHTPCSSLTHPLLLPHTPHAPPSHTPCSSLTHPLLLPHTPLAPPSHSHLVMHYLKSHGLKDSHNYFTELLGSWDTVDTSEVYGSCCEWLKEWAFRLDEMKQNKSKYVELYTCVGWRVWLGVQRYSQLFISCLAPLLLSLCVGGGRDRLCPRPVDQGRRPAGPVNRRS